MAGGANIAHGLRVQGITVELGCRLDCREFLGGINDGTWRQLRKGRGGNQHQHSQVKKDPAALSQPGIMG